MQIENARWGDDGRWGEEGGRLKTRERRGWGERRLKSRIENAGEEGIGIERKDG